MEQPLLREELNAERDPISRAYDIRQERDEPDLEGGDEVRHEEKLKGEKRWFNNKCLGSFLLVSFLIAMVSFYMHSLAIIKFINNY